MKYNIAIKLIIFIFGITLLSSCKSITNGMSGLTPVSDPFEYQNVYYPITVGNYWKMGYYKEMDNGEFTLMGNYLINVLDYTYQEIYFGSELKYLPIYRIEKQYIPLDSSNILITYQYAFKTEEGVIVSKNEPKDNKIEPYLFIPSRRSNDELSKQLCNKLIEREVKVKTPFFEMICLRVEVMEDQIGGSILFAKDKGHVVSLLYDNYPMNSTRIDNQIILSEFRVE